MSQNDPKDNKKDDWDNNRIIARKKIQKKIQIHVNLFAWTLMTLSSGWLVMGASAAWHFDIFVQMFIILLVSFLWSFLSYLSLYFIKKMVMGPMILGDIGSSELEK